MAFGLAFKMIGFGIILGVADIILVQMGKKDIAFIISIIGISIGLGIAVTQLGGALGAAMATFGHL